MSRLDCTKSLSVNIEVTQSIWVTRENGALLFCKQKNNVIIFIIKYNVNSDFWRGFYLHETSQSFVKNGEITVGKSYSFRKFERVRYIF